MSRKCWFIENDARRFATEHVINQDKQAGFIAGAKWVVEKLIRMTEIHPMEDHGGARRICDEFRLKEVNKFIQEMCAYVDEEKE